MSKSIGIWKSWALVTGMMVGSGILSLPAVLAPYGSFSFVGWLVTGAAAMCLAMCYYYLSARNPGLGGPYFYVREAFGALPAAIVGWGYWMSLVAGAAAISLSFAGYFLSVLPLFTDTAVHATLLAVICVVIFTLINLIGVKTAGTVQLVMTLIKIIPLLVVGVLGIYAGDLAAIPAYEPGDVTVVESIAAMSLLIMWAFIGVECATIPAEDIENPKKNIPRASLLGTASALAVYVIAMAGVMSIVPFGQLAASASPFNDAAKLLIGNSGAILISAGALFAIGGTLNVTIMVMGSFMVAGARDKVFPAYFSVENSAGTPARALLASSAVVVFLLAFNANNTLLKGFEYLLIISTFTVLITYLGSGLACIKLELNDVKQGKRCNYTRLVIAALASVFSLLATIGAGVLYT
ncbi:APC family permease [Alteromonas gilva]|uniref:Arginine/agmatine antiporter n=1 Tax=Alteromonas gilva TaxID=2987522 RepID=A0ABT5KZ29_9ALTE|nr:amino acid permease [Alteromonas gilva]MDC8829511.1 amino acid permease [Alteromonas gilva]